MLSKQSPVAKFRKSMDGIARKQMPYVGMVALTRTAWDVKKAVDAKMDTHLDNPTPFTKRGVRVKAATKAHLVAYVSVSPLQAKYLRFAVKGGLRTPKKRAILMPVGQRVNKFGNMPRKAVGNLIQSSKTFTGTPRGRKTPGIYKRMGTKKKPQLKLMVSFQDRATYKKLWPFYETAEQTAKKKIGGHILAAKQLGLNNK